MSGLEPREANDPHLLIRFFSKPIKNEVKSRESGRPIYDDVDYISIKWAMDKTRELEAPAHSPHRMKRDRDLTDNTTGWETYAESYPALFAQYKAGIKHQVNGTPVAEMTTLTAARIEELKALNIVTVEALAALDGKSLARLGTDGRKLMEQAAAYLQRAKGAAVDERHAEEVQDLRQQLEELRALVSGQPATAGAPEPVSVKAGKGAKARGPVNESEADKQARAAFQQMGEEDLRNYISDIAKAAPADGLTHAQLVDEAVKANAANLKRKDKAA